REDREWCCDESVVAAGGLAADYAGSLVRAARLQSAALAAAPFVMGATGSRHPSQLRQRVVRLLELDDRLPLHLTRRSMVAVAIFSLALLIGPLGLAVHRLPASITHERLEHLASEQRLRATTD